MLRNTSGGGLIKKEQEQPKNLGNLFWLVVSTHLKNISQNGNLPQIGVKIKNIWNHHLVLHLRPFWQDVPTILGGFLGINSPTIGICKELEILG